MRSKAKAHLQENTQQFYILTNFGHVKLVKLTTISMNKQNVLAST